MVLMVVCLQDGMPFDANGCVPILMNVDQIKWTYFCVREFEVGINDSIFSGNEQQKVYILKWSTPYNSIQMQKQPSLLRIFRNLLGNAGKTVM